MELRHLKYFRAVAEELHFGRAAERVHVVQPYLSRQIAALETELGAQLFARTTRGVTLTPAGEALLERVDGILTAVDEAVEVTSITSLGGLGRIEIGYVAAAMWGVLPSILESHRARCPDVAFHLHELHAAGEDPAPLLDGSLDIAFIRPVATFRALQFRTVWREEFVVVLPEDHRLASSAEVDLSDLADERFIQLSRRRSPQGSDVFETACRAAGFSPIIFDEGDSANVLRLVGLGFGVSVVPASIQNCVFPGAVFKPLTAPMPPLEIVAAFRKSDQSRNLRDFLETIDLELGGQIDG
jgi:LysR family transcriptional regulator, benzoate and cis,cis-muconate-responsive activator of ben and cat genes